MPEEAQMTDAKMGSKKKRKLGHKKRPNSKKKLRVFPATGDNKNKKKLKIDKKLQKLYRKRAREYNSDTEDDDHKNKNKKKMLLSSSSEEKLGISEEEEEEEKEGGIMKFVEGCRAFRKAFRKIMRKSSAGDDSVGPVLSAHKKLLAEKLALEQAQRKVKGDAKKDKHLVEEKGHVKPANFLDSHEKFLIGVATKGVVKLFNAVNKAQHAQKGLNPSRTKDAKVLRKRRKEAFFSELGKTSRPSDDTSAKAHTSMGLSDSGAPGWAPLRDGYMLTNSKLKDWDKMLDSTVADDGGKMPLDSSSDDD